MTNMMPDLVKGSPDNLNLPDQAYLSPHISIEQLFCDRAEINASGHQIDRYLLNLIQIY